MRMWGEVQGWASPQPVWNFLACAYQWQNKEFDRVCEDMMHAHWSLGDRELAELALGMRVVER